MAFEKGNKLAKGGPRPNSGRKSKEALELIAKAEQADVEEVNGMIDHLKDLALTCKIPQVQLGATTAWLDRKLGKPKERKEVDVNAIVLVDDLK